MKKLSMTSFKHNHLPWEETKNPVKGKTFYRKNYLKVIDIGKEIMLVKYSAAAIEDPVSPVFIVNKPFDIKFV